MTKLFGKWAALALVFVISVIGLVLMGLGLIVVLYLMGSLFQQERDMAGMSTALTSFASYGNSITYELSGHTVEKPRLVIQKRKVPSGVTGVGEDSFQVVYATVDSEGLVLTPKYTLMAVGRSPQNGTTTDRDAALVIFRDIVASDEFGAMIASQSKLA